MERSAEWTVAPDGPASGREADRTPADQQWRRVQDGRPQLQQCSCSAPGASDTTGGDRRSDAGPGDGDAAKRPDASYVPGKSGS